MDNTKYSEWHVVELKGKKYIFNPFFMGVGAWAELTFTNSPGRYATNQEELNEAFFKQRKLPSMYERFKNASPAERSALASQSMGWLNLKVKALKSNAPELDKIIKKKVFYPGGMFFFSYDAKYKDTLPYWDKFPLIILLENKGSHFLGVNIHYLPYEVRSLIIAEIASKSQYIKENDMLVSDISYEIIKRSKNYKDLKEYCIKLYLKSNVKSRILPVEAHEWLFAANLPVADMQKQSNSKVWKKYKR
jgi:hypothetical protein